MPQATTTNVIDRHVRIHRVLSDDGTQIAGTVHGDGPPLVLVNGGIDDGDTSWGRMLPRLTDRFTCYAMSTRGRGFSADAPDHASERLVEDVTSFAESIGEPVGLVGESSGAVLAIGAAARSAAVAAVAAYEPGASEALGSEEAALFEGTVERVERAVAEGRYADGARSFFDVIANDVELADITASNYAEEAARYVPVLLQEIHEESEPGAWSPTDPTVLARITAPVLLLRGADTALRWLSDGTRHVAAHVEHAEVRELAGVGHLAVALGAPAIADELVRFFVDQTESAARQPGS